MDARTVLMIDDEIDARKLGKLLLEKEGDRVLTAGNGHEGLILAKVERPHVILLDLMMPKLNGHDVLRQLKQDPDLRDIPVIMVTARGGDADIAASYKLGAAGHVEKPYEIRFLLQNISMVLTNGGGASPGMGA